MSNDIDQSSDVVEESVDDSSSIKFSDLGLSAEVLQAVNDQGYEQPTPIQEASIPPLLEGRDLLGQAQTGTGKTAAFALPLLSLIDANQRQPQLLILAPTRELLFRLLKRVNNMPSTLKA